MNPTGHGERVLTGTHALAMVLAFFLFIIATDTWLVYKAVSTFGGIETTDAYRKGLAYNDRMAANSEQTSRNWHETISLDGKTGVLSVILRDPNGAGIVGLSLTGAIGRAATNAFDRQLAFEGRGDGIYHTKLGTLGAGSWVLALEAKANKSGPSKAIYRSKARIWNKP